MKRNFSQIVRDRVGVLPVVALLTIVLDQASKLSVVFGLDLQHRIEMDVLPPVLVFRMAWNQGMNFGLFGDESQVVRWALVAIALAISVWVWLWVRRDNGGIWMQVAAGLLIGGALGNVIDRLAYGAVADFLNMSCCGIDNPFAFNVADIAVFLGAVGLVILTHQTGGKGTPKPRTRRKTP
ncbi:MAG: signal peptidase II [bacterium]